MNTGSTLYFISAIISLALYLLAPYSTDMTFHVFCFIIFAFQSVIVLRNDIKREGVLNFNVLFLFSYFLVSYAFPLLLMGVAIEQKEGIEAFIDFSVSCKCSALCTLAISIYFMAYCHKRSKTIDFSSLVNLRNPGKLKLVNVLYYLFAIILTFITINYMRMVGGIAVDSGFWSSLYMACLPLCLIYNTYRKQVKTLSQYVSENLFVLIPAMALVAIYFVIGDRGLVIVSGIVIVAVYSIMVKKISSGVLLIGIIVGSVLMYIVRETRTTESSLSSGNTSAFVEGAEGTISGASTMSVFSDLTGIHRELYIGYEYVQHNGLVEPKQIIIVPFYPLPLVPNIMSNALFGKSMDEMKPGMILNEYMAYSGHGHFGTHCVIDVYMRWGMAGVILFFYLWGYMVASISQSKKKNITGIALYVTLLAFAISVPRIPLLDMLRILSYVIIIVWFSGLFVLNSRNLKKTIKK